MSLARYGIRLTITLAAILGVALLIVLSVAVIRIDGPVTVSAHDANVLALGSHVEGELEIVALGDSYMSGEGTGQYIDGTDVGGNRCHRSTVAFPVLLAQRLVAEPVTGWGEDVHLDLAACSGAVTTNIGTTFSDPDAQGQVEKQYPEQDIQMSTLAANANADVVIVGVGGNDAGFSNAVLTCTGKRSDRDCAELAGPWLKAFGPFASEDAMADDNGAALLPQKLRDLLDEARHTAPHARYYVTTYPDPFSADACPKLGLNETEVAFIRDDFLATLNRWIKYVADVEGFEVIDLTKVFAGDGLCAHGNQHGGAMNPWKGQRNASLSYNPKAWLQGSVHPTAKGHELIAAAVERQVRAGLARPAPNAIPADLLGPVPPGPPPDRFTTILGGFCVTPESSLPCEIPGEPIAVVEDVQQGPNTPPGGSGPPTPPGNPTGPLTPGADAPPNVASLEGPTPPDPGTGEGELPLPPPLFVGMGKNTCVDQEQFDSFVVRPSGPLRVTEAVPGKTACYAIANGPFHEVRANSAGDIEIDTPRAVSGAGGNREIVYESSAAGGWVWRLETPPPETPDSDFSQFEAWLGSWWAGARLQELSRTQLILGGVMLAYIVAALVDLPFLIRRRRRTN